MSESTTGKVMKWLFPDVLNPLGLLMRAAWLLLLFGVLHVAGFRNDTSVLSGTAPAGGAFDEGAVIRGGLYVIAWLSVVAVVPVFVLGAGIMAALTRLTRRKGSSGQTPGDGSSGDDGRSGDGSGGGRAVGDQAVGAQID